MILSMCRGFGATERGILRVLHPPRADGEYVSLATVTHASLLGCTG